MNSLPSPKPEYNYNLTYTLSQAAWQQLRDCFQSILEITDISYRCSPCAEAES
jgi:hypothetical protein